MHYGRLGILLCFLAVIGGVSEVNSQKNFANVFEAQVFIENTLQLQELHIKQQIPYSTIYSSLEKQCPALALSNAKALAETLKQSRTTNIRPQALKSEMERRFTMLKNIIPAMKATDETLFCTQKYLTYTLLEHTQNLYYGKTAPSKASTTTPQKSQTPSLVQPPVEQVLESTHASADTSETPQYLHFTHHQNTLPNSAEASFTQVTDLYLQQEIGKLIALGLLTPNDLAVLDTKIEVNYLSGCGTTRGSYHMTQRNDGSNRTFKKIVININLCSDSGYIKNFSKYVRQILIHELGHYFYYFKDTHPTNFGKLCRNDTTTTCTASDFVSTYAMKNKEEDYAESFVHRYLKTTGEGKMIVDIEHGSANIPSNICQAKDLYFSDTYHI